MRHTRVTVPVPGEIRFEAQWIEKQYVDSDGEWNPDKDEYASSYHLTREAAETAALAASKKAGECEWILVAEQKYIGHEWVDQRRWTGDWEDGIIEQTLTVETVD